MSPTEPRSPVSHRKLGIFGVVALIAAGLVVGTGIRAREDQGSKLKEWTDDQAVPSVAVTLPNAKSLNSTIDLPGRLEAYYRAPIFARVSGYLKSWSVDMGARVKAGQVIAEIEAPDLDQQLLQARADLASQQASARLSEATLNRRKTLVASNFVSAQEIDERTADLSNKNAAVHSGPGQCRAPRGAGRLQEDHRAVRRRGHGARHRRRRADQRRRRLGPGDVRGLRHHQAARLRQRPPELRAGDQDRRQGHDGDAGIPEPDFPGDGGSLLAGRRRRLGHHAHAAWSRQFRAAS